MKMLFFIAGFALCYYLEQQNVLPDLRVIEWTTDKITFSINGKTHTLNIGEGLKVGNNKLRYVEDRSATVPTQKILIDTPFNTFSFNPGG